MALAFAKERPACVLVCPPLFDEHNKFRRQMVEVMRRLDLAGIDSVLPDLPGCNESVRPLKEQSLSGWRAATQAAAVHFGATHILSLRAGALLAPASLPGWGYVPATGSQMLRSMLRARLLASREAGVMEDKDTLAETARAKGLELGGWHIGPQLFRDLESAAFPDAPGQRVIDQGAVGGGGLWLRAEPDEDPEQADALAAIVAVELADSANSGERTGRA